eukprot:768082-Hanusia_phi.AAC.4
MGPLLGDSGNGYSMGLAALKAAARASDGRGEESPLLAMILDKYQASSVDGLLVLISLCSSAPEGAAGDRVREGAGRSREVCELG